MNIVIISSGILPNPAIRGGAVETLTDILIDYNEKYNKDNITLYSIYDDDAEKISTKYKYTKIKYIKISTVIKKMSRYIFYILNKIPNNYFGNVFIRKVIKEIGYEDEIDLVIVENICEFGLILNKITEKPLILHLHNDYLYKGSRLAQKICNSYKSIITVSDFISRRVSTIEGNINTDIITVYNGIDNLKFNNSLYANERIEIRRKYGINENDRVIIFSGRLIKEKGIEELLEAFTRMPYDESIKLVIVGSSVFEGAKKTKFVKRLEKIALKRKEQIIFTGYIRYEEMPKIYSIADIGVIPSTWDEPFGLTLIEQMSTGLPVIVSDSGAMTEIVNYSCGIIVNRDNEFIDELKRSMIYLLKEEQVRKEMGINAKLRAEEFSQYKYCKNFFEAIKKYYHQ